MQKPMRRRRRIGRFLGHCSRGILGKKLIEYLGFKGEDLEDTDAGVDKKEY